MRGRRVLPIAVVWALVALVGLWLGATAISAEEPPSDRGMSEEQWLRYRQLFAQRRGDAGQAGAGGRLGASGAPGAAPRIGAAAVVSVTGRVTDLNGNGIADAQIEARRDVPFTPDGTVCPAGSGSGTPTATPSPTASPTPFGTPSSGDGPGFVATTSGEDGTFGLSLSTGSWSVGVLKGGLLAGAGSFRRLEVQSSDITTATFTLLAPTNTIGGVVRSSAGQPVTSIAELVVVADGERMGQDGTLEFFLTEGLVDPATGAYSVAVVTGSWDVFSPQIAGSADVRTGLANITVTPNVTPTHDLVQRAADAPITGRVINDQGTPVPRTGISADLVTTRGLPIATVASSGTLAESDGSFTLPVFAGTWGISLVPGPGAPPSIPPSGLQIAAPASGQIITLLREAYCIQGRVTDPAGSPVPAAFLQGRSQPPDQSFYYVSFGTADAVGNYALPVGPGTWNVRADSNLTYTHSLTRTVGVPPDQAGIDLQLQPQPTPEGTLAVRVYLPLATKSAQGW